MCRLLVRHPCRSCHDRLPSHTLLLPLLVTHNLPLIYAVMGEGKLWPGTSIWILLEIRNKHRQYYRSKKTQTCLLQGCWAPRGHNGLRLGSTCASIRVSNKTWEDGKMARWQGGKVARWQGGKVARWQGGKVARWQGGKVARWQDGKVARWQDGKVARWQDG